MSSAHNYEKEARKNHVVEAIQESEFPDASSREIAEEAEIPATTVRNLLQELREEGRVEVTREVGPSKLYRVPDS